MSLFKRGNVWWSYFYREGVRHQYSTGTSSRRQAETIAAKLKEEVNNRRFQIIEADPSMTFGELASRFLASGSVRPHHVYHLKFLLPYFSETPVLRITKSFADEFRRARLNQNPLIKDATVNRDLSVLRHILYWAVDEQLMPANPLARMKMARERRTRRQVLSVAEEQLLLPVAKDHLRGMIVAALDTGMRRGEITSQRWEDIDFPRKLLFVTRSKTPEGESREIPMTERLLEPLLQHRQSQGNVFGYRGQPIRLVQRAWKTALKNAGLRHLRFHDLRHTFNTRLMEAGVLQEVRMALMGHSAGSKVHATYTHIELPVKREAVRKLEQWVNQQQLLIQEDSNARTETDRSETGPGQARGSQTVEEEDSRRGGPGTSRKAQGRDRRNGGGAEDQAQAASEVRRSSGSCLKGCKAMPLLDDELRSRLPGLHAQEGEIEPWVYARFFVAGTRQAWYVMEGEAEGADFLFFGFVSLPGEFGYFRLSELQALRGLIPEQQVERDLAFREGKLTDVVPAPDL